MSAALLTPLQAVALALGNPCLQGCPIGTYWPLRLTNSTVRKPWLGVGIVFQMWAEPERDTESQIVGGMVVNIGLHFA